MSDKPWTGKLRHARELCDDWGCIRDEAHNLIIRVNLPTHDESVLNKHRRTKTDPTQERVDAILTALNEERELAAMTAERDAWQAKFVRRLQAVDELTARAELAERQVSILAKLASERVCMVCPAYESCKIELDANPKSKCYENMAAWSRAEAEKGVQG